MRRQWRRRLAAALSVSLVLSTVNSGPLYASADGAKETIVGFEELDAEYSVQNLPLGAEEADIKFPSELVVE